MGTTPREPETLAGKRLLGHLGRFGSKSEAWVGMVLAIEAELAAEVEGLLALHYVTKIDCDPIAKTDTVRCNCSVWTGTPQPSIGAAAREYADHVARLLRGDSGGAA